jgi:hypothetical protein
LEPQEVEKIHDCETILALSIKHGFVTIGNWQSTVMHVKREALLRAHPGAFKSIWRSDSVMDTFRRFMPKHEAVSDEAIALLRTEANLPSDTESRFSAFMPFFDYLYVRWNLDGDAALFGHYWLGRGRSYDVPIVQWSTYHEPLTIEQMVAVVPMPISWFANVTAKLKRLASWRPRMAKVPQTA